MSDESKRPPRRPAGQGGKSGKDVTGGRKGPERPDPREEYGIAADIFDIPGTDPELLHSGRIPDPQPEHTPLFRWLAEVLSTIEEFLRARGGVSLRYLIRFFWGALAAVSVFLLVGPVINQPMTFDQVIASAKIAKVDWIARDAKIDYTVDRAKDGTFQTRVSERYNATFVNGPEPRITRTLVTEVNGHNAEFELLSATVDGSPATAKVHRKATTTDIVLTRADGSAFEGEEDVVIEYEMHHLAKADMHSVTGDPVDRWSWPLFAPTWPQATKGISVSITLPRELNDALIAKPYASISWLLVSGHERLDPEKESAGSVRYQFDNDDTLPPNSEVWVEFVFQPGTFVIPDPTPLFWWQTWGPLLPLAVLAVLMLFALAARWVVWADAAGNPWFVMREDPPDDLSPALAAQLLKKPRHAELVEALSDPPKHLIESWLRKVAMAGRRAGRAGNLPSALSWRDRWRVSKLAVTEKLRWVPDSYVRDTFIWAPIAVTLLQWALLRQLSYQTKLLIVWWPVLFVMVSTVLAIIALWAVWRPRPLTRKGALVVQQLKGIDVYARATRLIERGPLDDPLLPYAVLFAPPREAGEHVVDHAIQESGNRGIASGWRTEHFLSMPSMLSFVAALAMFAGSIVLVSTNPAPYAQEEFQTWPSSDIAGTSRTQTQGFTVDARLDRDSKGGARLDVVEHLSIEFDGGGYQIPQFTREWPGRRLGQSLGLEVQSVRVDGNDVQFATRADQYTTMLASMLPDSLDGVHEVEVRYTLNSPAVAVLDGGGVMQQVRWTAFLRWWDDIYYTNIANPFDGEAKVRPIRVQLTVAPDLANRIRSGGWIAYGDDERIPYESGSGYDSWVRVNDTYIDKNKVELRMGSETTRSDGALVVTYDADETEMRARDPELRSADDPAEFVVDPTFNAKLGKYELELGTDFGAVLNFAPGTFSNVDDGAYQRYQASHWKEFVLVLGLALFVLLLAAIVCLLAMRSDAGLSLLLVAWGTVSLLAVAQTIVFWWVAGPMAGDSKLIPVLLATGIAMWVAVIVQWIVVGRRVVFASSAGKPKAEARHDSEA